MLMNPRPIIGTMFVLLPEQHHHEALVIMQRIGKFIPAWAGATLLGVVTIGLLGVLVAATMVAIVSIVHDELYRKIFLPTVINADLDRLAGIALHEQQAVYK
jgi:hypothetical protein